MSNLQRFIWEPEEITFDDEVLAEARSDDDHFYGAWKTGGGRGGPQTVAQAKRLSKSAGFAPSDYVTRLATDKGVQWVRTDAHFAQEYPGMAVRWDDQAGKARLLSWEKPAKALKMTAAEKLSARLQDAKPTTEAEMNKMYGQDWRDSVAAPVRRYSENRYVDLNGYLRTGKVPDYLTYEGAEGHIVRDIAQMRESMRPLPRDVVLYRGVDQSAFGLLHDFEKPGYTSGMMTEAPTELVGKTFTEKGFMSTSVDPEQTMGGIQMVVRVPKGTPAIWAEPFTSKSGELEVILKDGVKFHVLDASVGTRYNFRGDGYDSPTIDVEVLGA